jgi:hypothetical protein
MFILFVIGLACTLVVSLVSAVSFNATLVSTVQSQPLSTSIVNPATGLKLALSVNTTSIAKGGAIDIILDEVNTLSTYNTVNASNNFRISGLAASPCGAQPPL